MGITDKGMQATPIKVDLWLTESFGKGNGALLGRITPAGARAFYYRYAGTTSQVRLPIGPFNAKGDAAASFTVAQARARALQWSVLRRDQGIKDLREHFAQADVDRQHADDRERQRNVDALRQFAEVAQAAELAQQRRLTVHQLFDRWRATDLQPALRADGTRNGRKDGGLFVFQQFTRHVFPLIGATAIEDLRKADLLAVIDAQMGKSRTAAMLLGDLKQMMSFALDRDLVATDPLASVKKARIVGTPVERDRVLRDRKSVV